MRYIFIFLLLMIIAQSGYSLSYQAGQDPKAYVTHLRIQYNAHYELIEAEGKISSFLPIYSARRWQWGLLASITIFIHPATDLFGTYPVDNLLGFIGFYANVTNVFKVKHLDMTFYPMIHESTHLVDGYDRGDINTDKVFDSNEYLGVDFTYQLNPALRLYSGFIFYLYFPPSAYDVSVRPLSFRLHIGEEWTPPINQKINYYLGTDLALFYEKEFHPALNLASGLDLANSRILIHYEYQRGLGQDFREDQHRLGIELQVKSLLLQ